MLSRSSHITGRIRDMSEACEDRYLDVLQNIEFAIVSVYNENPNLSDANVDRTLEGLVRLYNAEVNNRTRPVVKLAEADQPVFDRVREMCEWRLGRAEGPQVETGEIDLELLSLEEIVACLKRIRLSVKRWTTQGGRQGYLKFISQYVM
jgi:hypothetical protein